ncbi:MAG: hypothetical protein H0T42_19825 [Deltaproteobacteria bacterium]|nr:hypothetical protein [Deltaproteobacteria bacterium]
MMEGDDAAAYAALRTELEWPRGKALSREKFVLGISRLGELAGGRGAEPLAELAAAVAADPDKPDALYDLGYALIDAGAPAIAATVLWRCLAIVGDSEEVVTELVSALESSLAYPDALEVLEQHVALRARSFLARYLYAFNGAMSGRLAVTRAVLPELVADSPETEALHATIAGIVERANRVAGVCSLDARDLRGWHYVLTGGLLSHRSPYGFDDPMHGRYAWLADSLPRIVTGIDRLVALVQGLDLPCVYGAPGEDHELLGRAIATRLGIPVAPWPAVGVPAPGLVVFYDLADLSPANVAQLLPRRVDQVLYAHASPWTVDSPIAPDVTTLLYQSLVPPWAEGEGGGDVDMAGVESALAASPGLDAEEQLVDDPAGWASLVAKTWPPEPGPRSRLWAGGPVSSSRFT